MSIRSTDSIYPQIIKEEEVLEMIDQKFDKINSESNKIRIKSIMDFKEEVNRDKIKYQKKKQKYSMIKNILMGVDLTLGFSISCSGIVVEILSLGTLKPVSIGLGISGLLIISVLPLTMKVSDMLNSKNRNFEILCKEKLNKIDLIFSKALEDDYISNEEYELIMKVKEEYHIAKISLKKSNEKEVNILIEDSKNIISKSFKQLNSDPDIEKMKKEIEKNSKKEIISEVKKEMIEERKKALKEKMIQELDIV